MVPMLALAGFFSVGVQACRTESSNAALARFTVTVENISKPFTPGGGKTVEMLFSPGVWAIHTGGSPLFTPGQPEPGLGLEGLAEAGLASALAASLGGAKGATSVGVFESPVSNATGANGESPLLEPGFHYEFAIEARAGDRLSFAMMIGESNDGLVATGAEGIALFDASGRPTDGNVTSQVYLWDAGTEVNEEPGLGPNQGMRQGVPHAGDPERRPVRLMSAAEFGDRWPPVDELVRITLRPVKP
jgi:hypothetical protein